MFERVLVGVDGARGGRDAIALAARLAGSEGRLTFVHVRPSSFANPLLPGLDTAEADERASRELLEDQREAVGLRAELVSISASSPGRGLHDQAETSGCDLLVVGSSERGPIGRVLLGDDTRAALNGAPTAVAVASQGYAEHDRPLRRIGVGYDGSEQSGRALENARVIAARDGAEIEALQVVSLPTYAYSGASLEPVGAYTAELLAQAQADLNKLDGVLARAVWGDPGEELAAFGDRLDLLIVGSRGYGPWKRLMFGSTSDYLARHGHCSLLVYSLAHGPPRSEDAPRRRRTA